MTDSKHRPHILVLMPFESSFKNVYEVGIKPVCKSCRTKCERIDERIHSKSILRQTYMAIEEADLVVADMTGRNANVFYEVGYAHAKNKEVVLLTQDVDDIPFDLKHYLHIIYNWQGIPSLKEKLRKHIRGILKITREPKKSLVALRTRGDIPKIRDQIENVKQISILAVTGRQFMEPPLRNIYKQPGIKLEVVLANPEDEALKVWARQFETGSRIIREEIRDSIAFFCRLPDITIKFMSHFVPFSMLATDSDKDEGSIVVAFHTYKQDSSDRPYIHLTPSTTPFWYKRFKDQFYGIWKDARGFEVDLTRELFVIEDCGCNVLEQWQIIPLVSPGSYSLGVAVDIGLLQGVLSEQHITTSIRKDAPLSGEALNSIGHPIVSNRKELENLRKWPVLDLTDAKEITSVKLLQMQEDESVPKVSLKFLREGFKFRREEPTTILKYPEFIALIEGVDFRFPDPRLINDMNSIFDAKTQERDPFWYRTIDDMPIQWRGHSCEICDSENNGVRHIIGPSRIVKCEKCELEFDNPQAIIETRALNKYSSTHDNQRSGIPSMVRARQNVAVFIEDLMELAPSLINESLLEIGCASGEFMHLLHKEHHWPKAHLLGIEPSPESTGVARTKYGLTIINERAENVELTHHKYNVVVIINTMEHLPQPRLVFVHNALTTDGCLMIYTVPNVDSLPSLLFPEGFIAKNFPDGQHHFQYSLKTQTVLCKSVGFRKITPLGRRRDIVGDNKKATATWLAYSCGVPLDICVNVDPMLEELRERICEICKKSVKNKELSQLKSKADFDNVESLISFWKKNVWSSPHLSDAFDLFLQPNK